MEKFSDKQVRCTGGCRKQAVFWRLERKALALFAADQLKQCGGSCRMCG